MAATLGSLRTKVLSWLDEAGNTTETFTNVTNALNMAHQQRCTENQWSFMLWRQPETFNIVVGQRRYSLHPQLHRMLYVYGRTNQEYLVETPWREVQMAGVRWETHTQGNRFVFVEPSPVLTQPSVSSTISVVSSSSADTGVSYAINLTGMVDGVLTNEILSPTGLSVNSTTHSFDPGSLIAVSKISDWSGTATLTAGSTTLLTLGPTERSRSYPQVELLWTPDAVDTVEYRFYRKPRTLVNSGDVPDLPEEFADLLAWDALILMAAYDGDITSARLNAWQDQRDKLVLALGQTFLDGSTVGSQGRSIRDLTDSADGW